MQSQSVEDAIGSFMRALRAGDEHDLRLAAEEMKGRTRAHFKVQGVPVLAHPIVPPQFVRRVGEVMQELQPHVRKTELNKLVSQFGPDLRPGVAQEFARGLSPLAASVGQQVEPGSPSQTVQHAPTWGSDGGHVPVAQLRSGSASGGTGTRAQAANSPMQPQALQLPKAVFAGGKVAHGPQGAMRNYRLGNRTFLVPSGEHEGEIVSGVSYLAQAQASGTLSVANDPNGDGLILLDEHGRVMIKDGMPVRYSWQRLRELAPLAIIPREKWAAEQPRAGKMIPQRGDYTMITLHHTGSRDTPQAVLDLHLGNITQAEKNARNVGSKFGLAQTYDDYGDIGYNFLIGEDGTIYEGRALEYEGAHVSGHNRGNLGIAMLGDYSSKRLNGAQLRALEFLIRTYGTRLGITPEPRGGGVANSGAVYTHGNFDEQKHDELAGAQEQLDELMRRIQGPYR